MATNTFNPIVRNEAYENGFYPIIPIAGPKKAILLISKHNKSQPLLIENQSRIGRKQIKAGKFDWLVEIDLHPHNIRIEDKVLCSDQVSKFDITLVATATVTEPVLIYEEQIIDIRKPVEDALMMRIQDMAIEYPIEEVSLLRQEIKYFLGDVYDMNEGIRLTNFSIIVQADEKLKEQVGKIRDIKYIRQYENERAKTSTELGELYYNTTTAAFAEAAAGNISVNDALEMAKKGQSADFDERLRQIEKVGDVISKVQGEGTIAEGALSEQMGKLLRGTIGGMDKQAPKIEDKTEQTQENKNVFAPID